MSRPNDFALSWVSVRPSRGNAAVTWLQLGAAAATTVLAFAVALIATAFWFAPDAGPWHLFFSMSLVGVLALPIMTLGSATASLAARSRGDRLALLRLLGASSARVRWFAMLEVTTVALAGVCIGTAAASVLPFALGPLPVSGTPLATVLPDFPWLLFALLPPALLAVISMSGLYGLRQVTLSPLGVRTRADAPRMSWLRPAAAATMLIVATTLTHTASPSWGAAAVVAALGLALIAAMAVIGLLGPLLVAGIARVRARRTSDAARLIAFRGIADDPKTAWRGVSALALATFVALPSWCLLGYLEMIQRSERSAPITPEQVLLLRDARTAITVLLIAAFLVTACQVTLTQLATLQERRGLYVALHHIGMPVSDMQRSRRLGAVTPASTAVTSASVAALLLAAPVIAVGTVTAPLFTLTIVAALAAGLLFVVAAVSATAPALRRIATVSIHDELSCHSASQ